MTTRKVRQDWRSFEEAREFARGLGLTSYKGWLEWCKSGNRPPDIPSNPNEPYKDEWRGWPDWLGTSKEWRPFEEAREEARGLGLTSHEALNAWSASGERAPDIPASPEKIYGRTGEWTDWGDWLGTGNMQPGKQEWRPFEEAREFARGLGLAGWVEWHAWVKTYQRPLDIPTNPNEI